MEVLLVTSTRDATWGIPKGHVEPGMTPLESALQEAWEEAGVIGRAWPDPIGSYRRRGRTVLVFVAEVLEVLDTYPEARRRHREWFLQARAVEAVGEPGLADLLRTLRLEPG